MNSPGPLPKTGELPDHARASRERKLAEAEQIGLDAPFISALVDRFYARLRADELLGPIFLAAVNDWPDHLDRLKRFWRSVLHGSGEFTGNPMRTHMALGPLGEVHFTRWLEHFYATLDELEAGDAAFREAGSRARMIADSLLTGMELQRTGLAGSRAGENLPRPERARF